MNILSVYKFLNVLTSLFLILIEGGSEPSQILIESKESKTALGKPVFNIISFKEYEDYDYWSMKQSHHGVGFDLANWDNIAIKVHKNSTPYKVTYHQYNSQGKEVSLKVDCMRCHSGGPRAIRPLYQSSEVDLNIKEKLIIRSWNIRIKSYGDIQNIKVAKEEQSYLNEQLKVASCTQCHFEGGPRSIITRKQLGSIRFLIKEGEMPPWPHKISKQDKKELQEFIYGL